MPFKSKAQQRFMYAKHPAIAKRWSKEYPDTNYQELPAHVEEKSDPRSKKGARVKKLIGGR